MARLNMLLVLSGCMVLASTCLVHADRTETFNLVIYEQLGDSNELDVFGPRFGLHIKANNVGRGIIYSNKVTRNEDADSDSLAEVAGLYFYNRENEVQEVSSIEFGDIIDNNGRFANAQLHFRGLWQLDNGKDNDNQELSIVGGSGRLAGAYGTAKYERAGNNVFKVRLNFQIDEPSVTSL